MSSIVKYALQTLHDQEKDESSWRQENTKPVFDLRFLFLISVSLKMIPTPLDIIHMYTSINATSYNNAKQIIKYVVSPL